MKTFLQMQKDFVDAIKLSFISIDFLHGYAIIKSALDGYWEETKKEKPNENILLECLLKVSSLANLTSDYLELTEREEDKELKECLSSELILKEMLSSLKRAPSIQRGQDRWSVEFDNELLQRARKAVDDTSIFSTTLPQ
jgi:hypothetical protein